mgnify:CR=1 FL=1
MNKDLKIIKKKYGENMMHLCRGLFPTILEKEGILSQVILDSFEASHELYNDLISNNLVVAFENYIYERLDYKTDKIVKITKTPKELLSEAGYDLYECHTEGEIQAFKKYYSPGEELCTFRGGRLENCYVFFAVKKNIEEIKRANFHNPDRQDLYGTSVLSIQFTRDDAHHLSIKNRYNHTVVNPDATFSNNLDNIIPGLTDSFEKCYGMAQKCNSNNFEIPNYVCVGEKYYKYNYEIDNVYYCPNNIIIDNYEVKKLDKRRYILLDYYILDLQNKEIKSYQPNDSFPSTIGKITKIEVEKDQEEKRIKIETVNGNVFISLDKNNNIIYYQNDTVKKISDNFMRYNVTLSNLKLPQAQIIENSFLYHNKALEVIELPECRATGKDFLRSNTSIKNVYLPKAEHLGFGFLPRNETLEVIELPECIIIGNCFLGFNTNIKNVYLPKAKIIGEAFLLRNEALEVIKLPECREIGGHFLEGNTNIKNVYLPQAQIIGECFLYNNKALEVIKLPECREIGRNFLQFNPNIKSVYLPKAKIIEEAFLYNNKALESIKLPECREIGGHFLEGNTNIKNVYLPQAQIIENSFLYHNKALEVIELPECREIGSRFLENNKNIKNIYLPKAKIIGECFLCNNEALEVIELPECRKIGDYFLDKNSDIENVYLPQVQTIEDDFLTYNQALEIIELPKCRKIGRNFLEFNPNIKRIYLPQTQIIGGCFLQCNEALETIKLPECRVIEDSFLENNKNIKSIYLPEVLIIPSNLETIPQIQSAEKKDTNKNKCKTLKLSYINSP